MLITLALAVPSYIAATTQAEQARNEAALARKKADTAAQGQLTDRFSKAIEQLASDKLQIRLGGIYALDRIARDSQRDYPTIRNVLATFVREKTRPQPSPQDDSCPTTPPTADVQAAVTALGTPHPQWPRYPVDLSNTCLSEVDLTGTDLTGANLEDADLDSATLTDEPSSS